MTKLDKQIETIEKLLKEKEKLCKETKNQAEKYSLHNECSAIYEIKKTLISLDGNVCFM